MKALLLSFCLGLIHSCLIAQKPPVKFGDVSKEELSMTTYDKDPSLQLLFSLISVNPPLFTART